MMATRFLALISLVLSTGAALADTGKVYDQRVTFPIGSRVSETLVFFGSGSSEWFYQARLVTEYGTPFTSGQGFCTFNGTHMPTTGPSFSLSVTSNGSGGQWIVNVSGGFPKRPGGDLGSAHAGYVLCYRW